MSRSSGARPEGLGAVLVFELALGKLFERHREVVPLGVRLNHRRRVLAEAALSEVVEVAVDLTRALRRDDDGGVVGIGVLQELVYAWFDHWRLSLDDRHAGAAPSSPRTMPTSSSVAASSSSLTTR